jgi:hypothetical protein
MVTRRIVLTGAPALLVGVVSGAQAQYRTHVDATPNPFAPPREDEFPWIRTGLQALKDVKMPPQKRTDRALTLLFEGGIIPSHKQAELLEKRRTTKPYVDRIGQHARYTRMTFANEHFTDVITVSNVVAMTEMPGWKGKSRTIIGWQVEDREAGRIYKLEEPEECGNLLVLVTDFQLRCIEDKALCTPACTKLRRLQFLT